MQQEEIGLQHYLDVFWRRRWAIFVVFVIVFSLSLIGVAISDTTYKVHSKVAVKNQIYYRTSMLSFAQGTDAPATTLSGETYEEMINGLPFAQRVEDYLLKQGMPIDPMEVHASLKAEYHEPDLIKIYASSKYPDRAVALANAAADVFVEDTKSYLRDELNEGRQSAIARQETAKRELEEADDEIARFRREMGFVDIESEMQTLRDKIATFEQSRGEVITKLQIAQAQRQDLLNLAKAGSAGELYLDDPRLDEYRKLQESLSSARIRYTEDHPVVRNLSEQIKGIEDRLKETIARTGSNLTPEAFITLKEELARTEGDIANLQTAIDSWTTQINEVQSKLESYPDKRVHLQNLEARAAAARESYKTWTNRLEEIDFKSSKIPANAQLVDRAISPSPSISKVTSSFLAFLISLMLALGTGFLIEFADTTLRTPEEVTNTLRLGYLGSIAKLKEPRQVVFSGGKPVNQVAEAFTRVYSNIKFAEIESSFHTILVTSARKGEGKSTTLVNLSCAMAAAGKKVIVVDTDLRNPTVQRILGTKHTAGLTSVLAGETTLDDALKSTDHPGLSILPTGPIPPNPAELLHSRAMKDLVVKLKERADLVIFDSPPALLVADAMLLAGELDAAIIVSESGGVSRKAVEQVKESLLVSKTRILGVILNKIQDSPGAYYNYYSYYQYYEEPRDDQQPHTAMGWIRGGFGSIKKVMGGRS